MQYNESQYNGDEYNVTNYIQACNETMTESDSAVAFSVSIVKTDSQGSADALSDGVTLAALLDTVTIYQRAHTPFAYNNGRYNDFMYNSRADEDEILLMATKVVTETTNVTDVLAPFTIEKNMTETISTVGDTVFFFDFTPLLDVVVLEASGRAEITNKALDASIRLNDWISLEHMPDAEKWED